MPKKGWKNFLAVPKSGGNFFGGHNNFWGGNFWKNVKEKNLGGKFLGGGSTKGACDPVGMVRNEKKGKISPKKFRGLF